MIHPVLRHDGCGSGTRFVQRFSSLQRGQSPNFCPQDAISVHSPRSIMSGLACRYGHRGLPPCFGADRRRWQVTGRRVVARKAERHRQDCHASPVIECVVCDPHPIAQPAARRSVNGRPLICTRAPGAWHAMRMRAPLLNHTTGRGAWAVAVAAKRSAHKEQASMSKRVSCLTVNARRHKGGKWF